MTLLTWLGILCLCVYSPHSVGGDALEEWLLVSETIGDTGSTSNRHLSQSYPAEVVTRFNDNAYTFYGYKLEYGASNDYIIFNFVDSAQDELLLGDGVGLGPNIPINIIETSISGFTEGLSTGYWCKQCSSLDNNNYGDTCWGIVPSSDGNRGCGCNSGGWAGSGLYYGGYPSGQCNICSCWDGGFAGYKSNGQQKGGLNSVGFTLSIIFSVDGM